MKELHIVPSDGKTKGTVEKATGEMGERTGDGRELANTASASTKSKNSKASTYTCHL